MKTPGKDIFYTKYEIFPKIKLQLANADTFWGEGIYVSLSKRKIEIGSIVSELNPELWKCEFCPKRYNKATGCLIVNFGNQL